MKISDHDYKWVREHPEIRLHCPACAEVVRVQSRMDCVLVTCQSCGLQLLGSCGVRSVAAMLIDEATRPNGGPR